MTNYRPNNYQEPYFDQQSIYNYLQGRTEVCVREIWTQALGYPLESKPNRQMSNLIIRYLHDCGWSKADRHRCETFGQQWFYTPAPRPLPSGNPQPPYQPNYQSPPPPYNAGWQGFGQPYYRQPQPTADLRQATALLAQAVEILQRACL